MIFKTWITDLTKIQGVVNSIKSIELWANGATGLLNPNVVNNLSSAINGLNLQQAQLVLSTRNLTKEQTHQVLVQAGLIASENQIQAELVQSALVQAGLSAEKQKAILKELKLINATTGEIIATKACTKETLLNALATKGVTGANADAIISTLGLAGANGATTVSFGLLTASIWANIKALMAWLTTNPIGWLVLAAGSIFGAVKAFDALTVSFDEAVEKTKSSKEELDQLTSEINDLNNELKTTKDRIEELVEKANSGTISLLEEEELNNLREQNDELQREIALKEKLAEIDAKEAADNAAYSLTYKTDDNHWDDEYHATDRIDKLQSYVDSANYYQEKISEVNQQILDIEESATDGTYKNDSVYKDLINQQQKYQDGLQKTEELISSVYKELSTEDDSLYYNGKPIEGYEDLINRLDTVYLAVELYLNDGNIEDTTEKYIETVKNKLIKSGLSDEIANAVVEGFSEEELNSIMNSGSIDWSQCLGLEDATAVIENIKEQLASVGNKNEYPISLSITQTIDQLNTQLKPAFDSLQSAYKDIFDDDGKFQINSIDILSTCDSIKSKLDDLNEIEGITVDYTAFEDFVKVLNNTESTEQDVETAFDSLATSITQAALSGTEDFETMKSALEDLGVANSEMVAFDALIKNTEALKEAGLDLADATYSEMVAFARAQVSAENFNDALNLLRIQKILCAENPLSTTADIQNLYNLAQAAGIATNAIRALMTLNTAYTKASAEGNTLAATAVKGQMELVKKQVMDQFANIGSEVDFSNIGGGTKSAGKAGSSAGDAYVDAFEKELKALEDLRNNGLISEKEYLDRLRVNINALSYSNVG